MAQVVDAVPAHDRELVLARLMEASPEALYRCWTDPELLPRWFAPAPLVTTVHELDVRVGGAQRISMRDPASGAEFPAGGVYLELVPNRRIVGTSAFGPDWEPVSGELPFVMDLSFEPQADGRTLYLAKARHWDAETAAKHAAMGFHQGWGMVADQLEEVAKTL